MRLKKLIVESLSQQSLVMQLEVRIIKLEQAVEQLTQRADGLSARTGLTEPAGPQSMEQILRTELGKLADLIEFRFEKGQLALKSKQFLGRQNFRSVMETVRRHGGYWSSQIQSFVIKR